MDKDFAPYEESSDLKKLGFAEPCFAYYDLEHSNKLKPIPQKDEINSFNSNGNSLMLSAPTYSQAFRWFREKYDMSHSIDKDWDNGHLLGYEYVISEQEGVTVSKTYHTYEEAELACLRKLIEMVKVIVPNS